MIKRMLCLIVCLLLCGCANRAASNGAGVPYPKYQIYIKDLSPAEDSTEPVSLRDAIKALNQDNPDQLEFRDELFHAIKEGLTREMAMAEFGEVFANATWFKPENVSKVGIVAGSIPISLEAGSTLFVITCFRVSNMKVSAIYLRFSGHVSREQLLNALRGGGVKLNEASMLKKIAIVTTS